MDTIAALLATPPDVITALPGTDRVIAADLIGSPDAPTIVYLHGTPDSRLARHPDPYATEAAGVRLVAVDRPGFGHSSFDPFGTPTSLADDLTVLVDRLDIDRFGLLAWSAGAVWSLGTAAALGDRITAVAVVGGLVPVEAYDNPEVRLAAGDARIGMLDTAAELGPTITGELIGPMLVPDPATPEIAREHLRAGHPATDTADFAAIAGAEDQMAAAICDSVRHGTAGVCHDVASQYTPLGFPLAAVTAPVRLVYGMQDSTCPPAFGAWFARHIPAATLDVLPDAGHAVLLSHWTPILTRLRMSGAKSP